MREPNQGPTEDQCSYSPRHPSSPLSVLSYPSSRKSARFLAPRHSPCSSLSRQLIQELRQKQEKKVFLKKARKEETQGESAGEQARDKVVRLQRQRQQPKCKTVATCPPKQVNSHEGGVSITSTLPRLGPTRGRVPRRPLLRAQTH